MAWNQEGRVNIKTCPECRGRGFIYQSDYDSLGRYVRNYRCTNGHKWKTMEVAFSPETPAQQAAAHYVADALGDFQKLKAPVVRAIQGRLSGKREAEILEALFRETNWVL